jgi:hypothetical protein
MTLSLKFNKNITTNKKYYTFGTFPKSNRKIVERGKMDTLTQIHDRLLIKSIDV